MVFNLVMNVNNAVSNTIFNYNFLQGCFEITGDEEDEDKQAQICLASATIPYSWYSVNSGLYNNNYFYYYWLGINTSWSYIGLVTNTKALVLFSMTTVPALNQLVTSTGTDIPSGSYITSVSTSVFSTGNYTLTNPFNESPTPTPISNTYIGYLKAYNGVNGEFQIDPPTTIPLNTIMRCSAFVDVYNANYVSNASSSLLKNQSYAFVSYSATGVIGSIPTRLYLTSITDAVVNRYTVNTAITSLNSKISAIDSTNNLLTISNGNLAVPIVVLSNFIVNPAQPTLIYYISASGTFAAGLYLDNLNINSSTSIITGKVASTQNITNNSITFTGGNIPVNSVVNTLSIIVTSTTNFYVYPAISLAVNTFITDVGNQKPFITTANSTTQYTLASANMTPASTASTSFGYIYSTGGSAGAYTGVVISTTTTGKSAGNFITLTGTSLPTIISSINLISQNQFNIISQNAITAYTVASTIIGVPVSSTLVIYRSSTTTPVVGQMLNPANWNANFTATNGTINLASPTNLNFTITGGLLPFTDANSGFTYYYPKCFLLSLNEIAIDAIDVANIAINQMFYGTPSVGAITTAAAYIISITNSIATTAYSNNTPDTGTAYNCFVRTATNIVFPFGTTMPTPANILLYAAGIVKPITPTSVSGSSYTISASASATITTATASNVVCWFPSSTSVVSVTAFTASLSFINGTGISNGTTNNSNAGNNINVNGTVTISTARTGTFVGSIVVVSTTYYYINPSTSTAITTGDFLFNATIAPAARVVRTLSTTNRVTQLSSVSNPTASTNRFAAVVRCYVPANNTIYVGTTTNPSAVVGDVCFFNNTYPTAEGAQFATYVANSATFAYYITTSGTTVTANSSVNTAAPCNATTTLSTSISFAAGTLVPTPTLGTFVAIGSTGGFTSAYVTAATSTVVSVSIPISVTSGTLIRFYTPVAVNQAVFNCYATSTFNTYQPSTLNIFPAQTIRTYTNQVNNISFIVPQTMDLYTPQALSVYTQQAVQTLTPTSSIGLYPTYPITIYPPQNFTTYASKTYSSLGTYNKISLADGTYSPTELNTAFETQMILNNHYLTQTSTGNKLFYIKFTNNPITNLNYFSLSPIPATLPAGYTAPVGFQFSASQYTPVIAIPYYSQYGIGRLLGFEGGFYPSTYPQTTTQTIYGTLVPNNPVTSIIIRCNLINNAVCNQTDILDVIPIANTPFGNDIIYEPTFEKWIALKNGTYEGFFIYFQDQNFNNIEALDPNSLFSLLIKNGKKIKKLLKNIPVEQSKQLPYNLFSNESI